MEAPADRRRLAAYNYLEVAKLTAADAAAGGYFGISVAIAGNTIVGRCLWQYAGAGRAYVFRTSDGGATYGQVAKLTASDAALGDYFGKSVPSTAIPSWSVPTPRRWRRWARPTSSARPTAVPRGPGGQADGLRRRRERLLGRSVAIDGDTIVVGADHDDVVAMAAGSVYVFRTSDGGATHGQVAKLTAADAAANDWFGNSVAIAGDTIVVGIMRQ